MSVVHVVVPTVLTEMFRSRSVLGVYRVMFYINRVEKNSALTFDLCDTSVFPCLLAPPLLQVFTPLHICSNMWFYLFHGVDLLGLLLTSGGH